MYLIFFSPSRELYNFSFQFNVIVVDRLLCTVSIKKIVIGNLLLVRSKNLKCAMFNLNLNALILGYFHQKMNMKYDALDRKLTIHSFKNVDLLLDVLSNSSLCILVSAVSYCF